MSRRWLLTSAAAFGVTLLMAGAALGQSVGTIDAAPMQALPPPPPPPPAPPPPVVEPVPPPPSAPQVPVPPAQPAPPPVAPKQAEPQPPPLSSPAPAPSLAPQPAPGPTAAPPTVIIKVPESGVANGVTAPASGTAVGSDTNSAPPATSLGNPARPSRRQGPWSHMCVEYTLFSLSDILNEGGNSGWELTNLAVLEKQNLVCFRRAR